MNARWLLAIVCTALAGSMRAAEDAPVALPPFLVEEPTKGPPWRYGNAAGFEILSRCDEATTRRIVATHDRLHQLLAEILPPALQLTWTVPRTLILYDEELQPKASQEVIAKMLRDRPEVPTVEVDLPGMRGMRAAVPARRISFLPNLRLWDRDAMSVFMIVRRDSFDPERLALTHDYITFLVKYRLPTLPAWFLSGFLELYREVNFEGDELRARPLEWFADLSAEAAKRDPALGLRPLDQFFSYALPAVSDDPLTPAKRWHAQAALFVRWGLEPREPARREAFFRFVERTAVTGVNEELFQQCFGFDYAAGLGQLVAYLPLATKRSAVYKPAKFAKLPPYTLTPATDAQLARIKGDWERLQVPYVKSLSPELVPKYLELARRTLRRGYERASTDAPLLAVIGLCEAEAGNDRGAREMLEAAAQIGDGRLRPRASNELARLRLAERKAAPEGDGGLSATQLAEVLRPLFIAREQAPPLVETYELIADAWAVSAVAPSRRHLAVLDEGVKFFPRRTALALAAAELHLRYGFRDEARSFVEVAGRGSHLDEATRDRITALQQKLHGR